MTIYNIMGWGKGKTTSAIGISARALGNGEKVLFAQFLKNGDDYGIQLLSNVGKENFIHITQGTKGFNLQNSTNFFNKVCNKSKEFKPSLIILDEINVALDNKLIDIDKNIFVYLLSLEEELNCDIYMTGRVNNHHLRHKLIHISDVASNCYCEAHEFNRTCPECGQEYATHYLYCPQDGTKLSRKKPAKRGREC